MQLGFNILLALALIVALIYTAIVLVTGKGDAMSGGGSGVRTTFKGKAGFDDFMSRITLYLGIGFMALMLILDVMSNQITKKG